MKDHQIAILVSAISKGLAARFPLLPRCLREIIRAIVAENLLKQNLALDHQEK